MSDSVPNSDIVYLDNAATSWPKPPGVIHAMAHFIDNVGANPGRSGHRLSASAARIVFETRGALADLLGVKDSRHIVFTPNATSAINLALGGLLKPGDEVLTTSMEHNSVMRPLTHLVKTRGITYRTVATDDAGRIDPAHIAAALSSKTRLVVINHASNVVGTIAPIKEIKDAIGPVPLLVDAAQSAGVVPIDVGDSGIDLLAFTGHKGLLGPQGTGGLVVSPELAQHLEPLTPGGTGSRSEHPDQPGEMPDRFEGGTLNTVGLAGLGAALAWISAQGMESIRKTEEELTGMLLDGLKAIPQVTLYGPCDPAEQTAVVSFNIEGPTPSDVGYLLDKEHDVMVRAGLHCAPNAHRTLGTFPAGTVRLGLSMMNTPEHISHALSAIRKIANGASSG